MTTAPVGRSLTVVAAAVALATVGCGWGRDVGSGSRTDVVVDDVGSSTDDDLAGPAEPAEPAGSGGRRTAMVSRVIDGDSLELTVDGEAVELRLEGYNAPELYIESADGNDTQTCNGLAARAAVGDIVGSAETIELVQNGTDGDGGADRFGRRLGDLLVDGEGLVDILISGGVGLATGDDVGRRDHMIEAAAAGLGVWGDGCGEPVSDRLVIGEIQVDAPGNDRYNLDEEYVQIVNLGSEIVELDGWVLRDDTTGHWFPLPGRLAAGERLTIFTGGEAAASDEGEGTFYLEESFPVWSNDWETVILVDPNGVFADWRFVEAGEVLLQ